MKLLASSNSMVSESVLLDRASCRIGTLEALKLRIRGGVMPAGICFNTVCDIAETCANAALMFTVGWKKILERIPVMLQHILRERRSWRRLWRTTVARTVRHGGEVPVQCARHTCAGMP